MSVLDRIPAATWNRWCDRFEWFVSLLLTILFVGGLMLLTILIGVAE